MPTKKKRINIVMDSWMVDAVEGYRVRNNIISTSKAAVQLIEIGLKSEKAPAAKPEHHLDEAKVRRYIKALNDLIVEREESG